MHERLKNKTALVTGGSRGMGGAIAIALARAGANVAVNYCSDADRAFSHDSARRVQQQIESLGRGALLLDADLAQEAPTRAMVQKTAEHFGSLDVLVCNAGICPMHDFLEMPIELFDRVHAVNLRGHFICCQEAARLMIAQGGGGRIVAVSSISARVGGAQQSHYCPTKSGIHSLMQCLAVSLGPHHITCNSIGPGEVDTDMNRVIAGYQEYWDQLERKLPLRRIAQPRDIADPVVFLASDEARYITGQLLMVEGGWFSTPH